MEFRAIEFPIEIALVLRIIVFEYLNLLFVFLSFRSIPYPDSFLLDPDHHLCVF